jgi:hypothetical protein
LDWSGQNGNGGNQNHNLKPTESGDKDNNDENDNSKNDENDNSKNDENWWNTQDFLYGLSQVVAGFTGHIGGDLCSIFTKIRSDSGKASR